MPYVTANATITAARENTIGTKAAFAASGIEVARKIGVTDRRVDFPDRRQHWKKYKGHTGKREYYRQVAVRTEYGPAAFPHLPLDGFSTYLALGREATTGTYDSGASTTLSGQELKGQTVLSVTSVSGFSVGEFVEIDGAGTDPVTGYSISEVHEITAVGVSDITIRSPGLLYTHANGATVKEVIAPYTHTFNPTNRARKPAASIQALMNAEEDENDRFLRTFLGSTVFGTDWSADDPEGDGGDLRMETRFGALDIDDDDAAASSYATSSYADVDPFMYYHTKSGITAFGRSLGTVQSFKITQDDKPAVKRYFGNASAQNPSGFLVHMPEYRFTLEYVPDGFLNSHSNTLYDLMRGRTKGDVTLPFLRDGAASFAASEDAYQIELLSCALHEHAASFGEDYDEWVVPVEAVPTSWRIKVKDSVPMYARV